MTHQNRTLVIGAAGQIGTELVTTLRSSMGPDRVVAADLNTDRLNTNGPVEMLDVLDKKALLQIIEKYQISEVYLLAALLSATAEKNPALGWQLNMDGLFNILDLAREEHISKVFWPSSIAVFGPNTPRHNTPQRTVMEPRTVYGISKVAGESWCEYYHLKYGVDVRSIRYPGLIGYKSAPGGGTTDYAVHIFHEALRQMHYTCFLEEDVALPMMYMPDAIEATLTLMKADAADLHIRSSYNISGLSFTPAELAAEIRKHIPEFKIDYQPDYRNQIAKSWPASIDDTFAQNDWGWKAAFDLQRMTADMLQNLS